MAKAKKVTQSSYTLTLELSQAEAEMLLSITDRIGGDPQKSRRRYSDAIRKALVYANVNQLGTEDFSRDGAGSLYLNNEVTND